MDCVEVFKVTSYHYFLDFSLREFLPGKKTSSEAFKRNFLGAHSVLEAKDKKVNETVLS